MARTETLRPNADIIEGWENPPSIGHFSLVSDQSDLTGIYVLTNPGAVDRFGLPNLPGDAVDVTSLAVRFRVVSVDGVASVRARLYDGVNLLVGPTWTPTTDAAWFTWAPALAPDGGPWTVAKVAALAIDAEVVTLAFGLLTVHEIEVPVLIEESSASRGRVVELELPPLTPPVLELPRTSLDIELPRTSLAVELPPITPAVIELPRASVSLDENDA